jgi:plastocyanin
MLVLLVLASAQAVAAGPSSAGRVVVIEAMRFQPETIVAHRGERVTWINKDLFAHTVSATSDAFDSASIAAGASWTYTVGKTGRFDYLCRFHPTMKGALIVE